MAIDARIIVMHVFFSTAISAAPGRILSDDYLAFTTFFTISVSSILILTI
jgi:hypothetical protein